MIRVQPLRPHKEAARGYKDFTKDGNGAADAASCVARSQASASLRRRGRGGKPQLEHCAAAVTLAVSERAALSFREAMRDGEPQSGGSCIGNSACRTVKWREQSLTLGRGDSGAAIGNAKNDLAVIKTARHVHRRVHRRMLERVVHQVGEDPQRVNEVETAQRERGRIVERDLQAVPIRPAGHVLHDGTEEIVGGIDLDVERQRTAVEARDIQQVGDETIQPIRLLFYYERPLVTQRLELVGKSFDRSQRRPQIVRHGSQKCILELIGFPQHLRSLYRRALGACAIEKLGGDEARYEKCDEDDPVERIANQQRVIWRKEEPVEYEKGHDRDRYAEDTPAGCARREDNEEKNERDVGLVEVISEREEDGSRCREAGESQTPRHAPRANPVTFDSVHDGIGTVIGLVTRSEPIPDSRLSEDVAGT